jgi:surface antigen
MTMDPDPNRPDNLRSMEGRSTVAAIFQDRTQAERAIDALRAAGFAGDQIGVALRDRRETGELVEETGTNAVEGAVSGALGGGLLGGVAGFLVGLISALAIPGIGPIVAGGALASALGAAGGTAVAGAGIGAAAGGLVGALSGMGIPEEEARHLETGFRAGGVLVTVSAGHRASEALGLLERHGGDTGMGTMTGRPGMEGRDRM